MNRPHMIEIITHNEDDSPPINHGNLLSPNYPYQKRFSSISASSSSATPTVSLSAASPSTSSSVTQSSTTTAASSIAPPLSRLSKSRKSTGATSHRGRLDDFEKFRRMSNNPVKLPINTAALITLEPMQHRPRSKSMLTKRSPNLYPPDFHITSKFSPGSLSPHRASHQIDLPIVKTSFRSKSMKERGARGHRRSIYVPLVESEQNFLKSAADDCRNKEYKTLVWSSEETEIENPNIDDQLQLYRMRSFKRTSKGIVSQADTIKARSIGSLERLTGDSSKSMSGGTDPEDTKCAQEEEDITPPMKVCSKIGIYCNFDRQVTKLEIQLIGSTFVGKTTMASQLMTSEHICGRMDSVNEDSDKFVSVYIDDQEWNIWLHDTENRRNSVCNEVNVELLSGMDGYLVLYAIDDMSSYLYAKQILCDLVHKASRDSVIVLVANKSDLERSREVPMESGKQLAKIHRCLFYEVSTVLNHKIDELLIKTLLKIRNNLKLKEKRFLKYPEESALGNRRVSSLKITGKSIKNFFRRKFNGRSCDMK